MHHLEVRDEYVHPVLKKHEGSGDVEDRELLLGAGGSQLKVVVGPLGSWMVPALKANKV